MFHINREEEKTILVVRKHWFILLSETLGVAILFALPFGLIAWLNMGAPGVPPLASFSIDLTSPGILFVASIWSLFMWAQLFKVWTNWYLDFWIVTDKRIVSIDQIRFFVRQMTVFRMERIQDVMVEIRGLISTFLNFGTLHVQTAGEDQNFYIRNVPNPQRIKDAIMSEHDAAIEMTDRTMPAQGL